MAAYLLPSSMLCHPKHALASTVCAEQPENIAQLTEHQISTMRRYADKLEAAHDGEHLAKFEELLEAAVDLDRIPDEYLICASYDADLQVLIRILLASYLAVITSPHAWGRI